MPKLLGRTALVVALVAAFGACGDDDDAGTTPTSRAEEPQGGTDGEGEVGGEVPSSLEFVAIDIDFERDEVSAAAGDLNVSLVNDGAIEHSWVVDGHEDDLRLYVQQSGETDEGTITLDAGEYEYYCDIAGHREAGMEGTLTLE